MGAVTLSTWMIMLAAFVPAYAADCAVPTLAPSDIAIGPEVEGRREHIVTGEVGICDAGERTFDVILPDLHDLRDVKVQLALSGFGRRYGVHQIGFALGSVTGSATPNGVKVQYTATIDGLERYQLAYTLYLSAKP